MIESDEETGVYLVICDTKNCNTEDEYDTDGNWDEFMRQMKLDGWRSQKVDDEWKNYCSDCTKNTKRKDNKK
jgi:hypothetical protein